MIGWLAEVSW